MVTSVAAAMATVRRITVMELRQPPVTDITCPHIQRRNPELMLYRQRFINLNCGSKTWSKL
jgi:hypothetical protein